MLERTLAGPFEPGSNVRADVVATSWVLLLHDLGVRRALLLGDVDDETRSVVGAIADEVSTSASDADLIVVARGAPAAAASLVAANPGASVHWSAPEPRPPSLEPSAWLVPAREAGPWGSPIASGAVEVPFVATQARSAGRAQVDRARRVIDRWLTRAGLGRFARRGARKQGDPDRAGSALALTTTAPSSAGSGASLLRQPASEAGELPRWISTIASGADVDLAGRPWRMNADADYRSQKAMFLVGADLVIKVTRDARFSARLLNEHASIDVLARHGIPSIPRPIFAGEHRGLAVVGESAVPGVPFAEVTDHTPACPHLHAVLDWATELATNPALVGRAPAADVGAAARRIASTFAVTCAPDERTRAGLDADAEALAAHDLPTVFMHGDLGTWNVLVAEDDVGVLDWENGDPRGAPLWDAGYLVLTHAMRSSVAGGVRFTPERAAQALSSGPWRSLLDGAVARQCAALGIPEEAADPLLRLAWAHLAVKESTRLQPGRGDRGFWARFVHLLFVP